MINFTVICLGKLKEAYLRDACAEYIKRLGAFCKINIIELSAQRLPDNPSEAQISAALEAEAQTILKKIPQGARVYAMCIEGKMLDSTEFSRELERAATAGSNEAVFIIGSSFGLAESVKAAAQSRFSMSPMTFPHQLARVMLLEQLYRAAQISVGGKYHK